MTQPELPDLDKINDPDWRARLKVQLSVIMAEVSRGLDILNDAMREGDKR